MEMLIAQGHWLPIAFAFLMGLAILIYVILDGYDLGVGILFFGADDSEKDLMIASIGPFWDANETWLVLGAGILLVAFPFAHGKILTALYIPTAVMLIALILRGVSFDFRSKVQADHKYLWNRSFFIGSFLTALSQGYMLGQYIMSFENSLESHLFSLLSGFCLVAGYTFIGACWLIMKCEDLLQEKAVKWARMTLWVTALGIGLISITTPVVNEYIFDKWFSIPNIFLLAPIPVMTILIIISLEFILRKMPFSNDRFCWLPFASAIFMFVLCFHGLAYSFYPYIILEKMTLWQASGSAESLMIIFAGAMLVLPFIIGYTIFSYYVFRGKAEKLQYY